MYVTLKTPRVTDVTAKLNALIVDLGALGEENLEESSDTAFILQNFDQINGATIDEARVQIL
jgi:hypothetical protein